MLPCSHTIYAVLDNGTILYKHGLRSPISAYEQVKDISMSVIAQSHNPHMRTGLKSRQPTIVLNTIEVVAAWTMPVTTMPRWPRFLWPILMPWIPSYLLTYIYCTGEFVIEYIAERGAGMRGVLDVGILT
ncbi:hypothetical protein F5Y12DRAFT_133243 [Xylaria sp. FL1777]|nr:hypothetical protein F5Y12DRAFT_133243 [Xylaria sp. FL1777]